MLFFTGTIISSVVRGQHQWGTSAFQDFWLGKANERHLEEPGAQEKSVVWELVVSFVLMDMG